MKRSIYVAFVLCVFLAVQAYGQTTRPVPAIERAVVISVDGLRPDVLLRAKTPNIRALYEGGSFTFWARTTALAITLPSHTSMLTGVTPLKHEIWWNKDLPLAEAVYPSYPTLFELASRAGYTTGMVAGKSKFATLAKPHTLTWCQVPASTTSEDPEVAQKATQMIREHRPQVLFIHFPSVDNTGHAKGWGSPEQLAAAAQADQCVGLVLSELKNSHLLESTVILLTADHGGAGRMHGPDDPRSRHIPWIVYGPGIRKGLDLTLYRDLVINTEDTFATICYLLAIPPGRDIDGKPVKQIVEVSELMHDR